jgi:hypothetical protein
MHVSDYKIVSTNSSTDTFTTGRVAGDMTPFSIAVVVDLGLTGQYGVTADRRRDGGITATVPPSLEHATIGRLADLASSYEFVLHPGDLGYAGETFRRKVFCFPERQLT